jgi:hypothetical protein
MVPATATMAARATTIRTDGCPKGKTPARAVNTSPQKHSALPKFGNGVSVAHPGSTWRGDRTSSLIESWACGGRGSVGTRGVRAGRVVPVSPKPRVDERRCQVRLADISMATCTMPSNPVADGERRTAKPCGPGRRCYGQAFRGGAERPTGSTASSIRGSEGGQNELGSRESTAYAVNPSRREGRVIGTTCMLLCGFPALHFRAADRGCEVSTRPSLHPLGQEGGETKQARAILRREAAKACL